MGNPTTTKCDLSDSERGVLDRFLSNLQKLAWADQERVYDLVLVLDAKALRNAAIAKAESEAEAAGTNLAMQQIVLDDDNKTEMEFATSDLTWLRDRLRQDSDGVGSDVPYLVPACRRMTEALTTPSESPPE